MRMSGLPEFCASLGATPPEHVMIGKRCFSDPNGLLALAKERGWEPFSVGIFLGEEKGRFRPTPALIQMIAPSAAKHVTVSDKAAWLFLCGKDILMQGIVDAGDAAEKDLVIVHDPQGDVLGYGEVTSEFIPKAKNRQFLKNRLDLGEYLRRER